MAKIWPLPIKDAYLLEFTRYHDHRGYLGEIMNMEKYPPEIVKEFPVVQNTLSMSKKHTLRGVHISPYCKLMTCAYGTMYDIIVDVRPDSPTYLMWLAVKLDSRKRNQLMVPAHCGHAYYAMEDDTITIYCQNGIFGHDEKELHINCPIIDVFLPTPEGVTPFMSPRDSAAKGIDGGSLGFKVQPKRTRVVIIGASGQVGGALRRSFNEHRDRYVVYSTFHQNTIDIAMPFDLEQAADDEDYSELPFTLCHPHVVIICAAFSWVDGCEKNQEQSKKINTTAVQKIAEQCKKIGAKLVIFSSDYVFDGESARDVNAPDSWNDEETKTNPVNVYGQQKKESEVLAAEANPKTLVIRTSRVYGPESQGKNFVYQVAQKVKAGEKVPCLKQEISCATYNRDLAEATRLLLEGDHFGTYHVTGPEAWSKKQWGDKVASHLGLKNSLIEEVEPSPEVAARPKMVAMATKKLRKALPDFKFRTFDEAMADWRSSGHGKPLEWPME